MSKQKTTTADLVDQLGLVKAQAARIAEQEKAIKEELIARGVKESEGAFFRVTISESERETLDLDAVRAKLSAQFIRAHTRVTPVTTVRVSARVTNAVADQKIAA